MHTHISVFVDILPVTPMSCCIYALRRGVFCIKFLTDAIVSLISLMHLAGTG
jgi:hypothetical protein